MQSFMWRCHFAADGCTVYVQHSYYSRMMWIKSLPVVLSVYDFFNHLHSFLSLSSL
eukprot:c10837_g1_i1 orf=59-226(-)